MSKARRLRIWERDGGVCYLCGKKVLVGQPWDAEHVKAWTIYGDDSDENLKVAHKEVCHKAKTDADMRIVHKSNRQGLITGQQARRAKRGFGLIQSRNEWPKGQKLQSRGFAKKPKGDK
jgi:5-methylcytosine-specific restriction endonuclease McrA